MSIVAPIAPFTCEDIYQFYIIDGKGQGDEFKEHVYEDTGKGAGVYDVESIFQNIRWPSSSTDSLPSWLAAKDSLMSAWAIVGAARDATKRQIELIRKDDVIQVGDDLEAKVEIIIFAKQHDNVGSEAFHLFRDDLADIFGTSEVKVRHIREAEASSGSQWNYSEIVSISDDMQVAVNVDKADGKKCLRCWKYSVDVSHTDVTAVLSKKGEIVEGEDGMVPLCPRCANVVADM